MGTACRGCSRAVNNFFFRTPLLVLALGSFACSAGNEKAESNAPKDSSVAPGDAEDPGG